MLKSFTRSKKYKAVLGNSPAYVGGEQAGISSAINNM